MFACRVERGLNVKPRNVLTHRRFANTATEVDQSTDCDAISFDDYLPICIDELEQERKLHRGIRVNQVAALFHEAGLAGDECMDYATQALDGELEALSLNASPGKASPMQQICEVCNEDDPATIRILFIHHDSYARQNKEDMNFFCNDVFPFSDKKDRKHVGVSHVGEAQKAIHDFFMSDGEEINAGGALQAAIVFLGHGVDGKFCLPSGEVIGIHEIEQFVRECWEESRLQRPETRLPATVLQYHLPLAYQQQSRLSSLSVVLVCRLVSARSSLLFICRLISKAKRRLEMVESATLLWLIQTRLKELAKVQRCKNYRHTL